MGRKYWAGKKVLITGYEGFLGSNMTLRFLDWGTRVVGLDRNFRRPNSLLTRKNKGLKRIRGNIANYRLVGEVVKNEKPDAIIHLAAQAIVGKANLDPVGAFKSNIQGTWNILEACRQADFKGAVVIASSDKAYGSHKKLPYTEKAALKGDHPYDVSKSCTDLLGRTYFNTYGLNVGITRCGNIYGPGDFHFSRIVPDTIKKALKNKKMIIRSDGTFTRDYVFVQDVIDGYLLIAQKIPSGLIAGEAFNLSNEAPISVLDLVKKIYQLCEREPNYEITNQAEAEIRHQYLSAKKAQGDLGWKPGHTLDQGLLKTIEWYREKFA